MQPQFDCQHGEAGGHQQVRICTPHCRAEKKGTLVPEGGFLGLDPWIRISMNIESPVFLLEITTAVATVSLALATWKLARQSAKQVGVATAALKAQVRPLVVVQAHPVFKQPPGVQSAKDLQPVAGLPLPGLFHEPIPDEKMATHHLYAIAVEYANLGVGPALNLALYLYFNSGQGEKTCCKVPDALPRQIVGAKPSNDSIPYLNAFETDDYLMFLGYALTYENIEGAPYWTEAWVQQADPLGRMDDIHFGEGPFSAQESPDILRPTFLDSQTLNWVCIAANPPSMPHQ